MNRRCTKVVRALMGEAWSMSLFGRPKVRFQCGDCGRISATRDWLDDARGRVLASCPCGVTNYTGLAVDE